MNLTPVKTPNIVKRLFPNYIWDMPAHDKVIYLTFDDGPTPEITNWTLSTLKQFDAKATFFCIGKNIKAHPDIFQNILSQGHTIGNHTNNHIKGWKTKTNLYLKNVEKAQEIINVQLRQSTVINSQSKTSTLFRPPYGEITPKQGKRLIKLGYKIIMWDVLAIDWDNSVSKQSCLNNVISKASNGSIIVFHDSIKAEKNMKHALPRALKYFRNLGYTFKALS